MSKRGGEPLEQVVRKLRRLSRQLDPRRRAWARARPRRRSADARPAASTSTSWLGWIGSLRSLSLPPSPAMDTSSDDLNAVYEGETSSSDTPPLVVVCEAVLATDPEASTADEVGAAAQEEPTTQAEPGNSKDDPTSSKDRADTAVEADSSSSNQIEPATEDSSSSEVRLTIIIDDSAAQTAGDTVPAAKTGSSSPTVQAASDAQKDPASQTDLPTEIDPTQTDSTQAASEAQPAAADLTDSAASSVDSSVPADVLLPDIISFPTDDGITSEGARERPALPDLSDGADACRAT